MLNILKLYAVYTRDTDNEIIRLLSGFSEVDIRSERNIFCRSILNLFTHIVRASWHYQRAIHQVSRGKYCAETGESQEAAPERGDPFEKAAAALRRLDERFIDFIDRLEERDLALRQPDFKTYDSRTVVLSVGEVITQHITHQIHHRGQLSQVLDELKVAHDIGNIWPYVKNAAPGAEEKQ